MSCEYIDVFKHISTIVEKPLNLDYDDTFTGLISKDISYINLGEILINIGVKSNSMIYNSIIDKFDDIVDELSEYMKDKNVIEMIYSGYFGGFVPKHIFAPKDYFFLKVEKLVVMFYKQPDIHFRHFTNSFEIDIPKDVVNQFIDNLKYENTENEKDDIWLTPYMFYDDHKVLYSRFASDDDVPDNIEYEIPLQTILKRAILKSEVYYQLLEWLEEKSITETV